MELILGKNHKVNRPFRYMYVCTGEQYVQYVEDVKFGFRVGIQAAI